MSQFTEYQKVLLVVLLLMSGLAKCQTGLSSADMQQILDEHNRLRGLVNPTAANMERMVNI